MAVNISRDMQFLNLNGTQLPAIKFAQRSLREVCGANISTHLYHRHAHAGKQSAPPSHLRRCSQRYRSGAANWDQLHAWEGRNQIREWLLSAVGMPLPLCAFLCLAHYATARGSSVLLATYFLALFPAVLAIVLLSIVRSRLR